MRKLFFSVFLFCLFFFSSVSAEGSVAGAGITPQSPFYILDVFFDKIALALHTDAGKKADLGFEIAHERLLEIQEMLALGKNTYAFEAVEAHGEALFVVEDAIDALEQDDAKKELEILLLFEKRLEGHDIAVWDLYVANADVEDIFMEFETQLASLQTHLDENKERVKNTFFEEDGEALEVTLSLSLGLLQKKEENARHILAQAEQEILLTEETLEEKGSDHSLALLAEAQDFYAQALVAFEAEDWDAVEDFAYQAWQSAYEAIAF